MSNAAFWDKIAAKYAKDPIKDMQAYEETLARARHYLTTDDHLLEVGCGTGTTALKLADAVAQITATDISGEMIRIAQGKQQAGGVNNVSFQRAEITQPLTDAPFDAVFASSILHLVDDLDTTLSHLRTQIKPGGYVISKTACLRNMAFFIRPMVKLMQMIGKAPPVLVFSTDELELAFKRAGFSIVETGHFGKNTYAHFIVARRPG